MLVVFYNKLSCLCLNYLKKVSQTWWFRENYVLHNKLSWSLFELSEKDVSNVVVQCW